MGLFRKSRRERELEEELDSLREENESLSFHNFLHEQRISELEDLCEEKDEWMDTMMSDALRHGSSEGGRQMAYKREYLKRKR